MNFLLMCLSLFIMTTIAGQSIAFEARLLDGSEHDVTISGIQLVDWDGYIANPGPSFKLKVIGDAKFPVIVDVSSSSQMVYFDSPASYITGQPIKQLTINSEGDMANIRVSIFPDRNSINEIAFLNFSVRDSAGVSRTNYTTIQVLDQDSNRVSPFRIHFNYNEDKTGFFLEDFVRRINEDAGNDWAYFIDQKYDDVPAGSEPTPVRYSDSWDAYTVTNTDVYDGFIIYMTGINTPRMTSGAAPSHIGGYQHINNYKLPLRRSGNYIVETRVNKEGGWLFTSDDSDWWKAVSYWYYDDYYSLSSHEIGHILAYSGQYPFHLNAYKNGGIETKDIIQYLGRRASYSDEHHHLQDIDPDSGKGAFGSEYRSIMPTHPILITKLDLMILEATGYKVYKPYLLNINGSPLIHADQYYNIEYKIGARGGVPPYKWLVSGGALPAGITLDETNGSLIGAPLSEGDYEFNITLKDSSPRSDSVTQRFRILVKKGAEKRRLQVLHDYGGNVSVSPNGITCGAKCYLYSQGEYVELSYKAASDDFYFSGWSGACSGTGSCAVTMNTDKQVTASFSKYPATFKLNASVSGGGIIRSSPQGIDCGLVCSASFGEDSNVVLLASPNEGYDFIGWTGACSGNGACVVTMDSAKNVTATFLNPYNPTEPYVKPIIASTTAFVKKPFVIGWTLNQIKKGMPVQILFAKDGATYRVLKSAKANVSGIGSFIWKPIKTQRTENGLLQICAVPSPRAAKVCSLPTSITVQ